MGDKTFNLTWNNHLANLSGLFEGLYKSGSLTDTTLACQGGMLRAHRLVLAACSPYFERVFKEHYGEQPILILKGVAVEEMECLLDFMYRGSIDVAEEHLPSLIKTSTDLEIRGLSGDHRNEIANSYPRNQRCLIETRVSTTEFRKDPASMYRTAQATLQTPGEPRIKVEDIEVEDDPMVIDGQEEPFDEASTSNDSHLRQLPPPLYRRDSRFRGQKRVSVGRLSRSGEMLDSRSKDLSTPGDSFDDSILLQEAMRPEVNFTISGSDPTVPSIQMNDEEQEGDEHANVIADENLEELGEPTDTSSKQQKSLNIRKVQCNLTDAEIAEKNVEYRQNPGEPAPKTIKYPTTCEATKAFLLAQINAASIQTNVSCVQRTERNLNTSSFSYRNRYVPVRYNSPNIFPHGLKAYLHSDIRGRTVIASGDKLDGMSRQKVVRCVVDYLFMNFSFGNIIRKEHFVKAASEIILAYPEEIESTYFVPGTPRTKTASKTLNKGKLWSRYCNVKIRLGGAKTNTLKDGTEEQPDSPRSYVEDAKDVAKKNYAHGRPLSKNQYKPFSCDLCTLAFTRASHLARHRRVHTGERPFACSLCPRMFARQDKLKQHLDSHLQWPRRKVNAALHEAKVQAAVAPPVKGKRGRPRKVAIEQTMDEIFKFGEFSSLLNKSQQENLRKEDNSQKEARKANLDELGKTGKKNDCLIENGEDTV